MTMRLRDCPKCEGDVRVDRDEYGWYEQCIQCGYIRDLAPIAIVPERKTPGKGENWYEGSVALEPIDPFSLPPELGCKR